MANTEQTIILICDEETGEQICYVTGYVSLQSYFNDSDEWEQAAPLRWVGGRGLVLAKAKG